MLCSPLLLQRQCLLKKVFKKINFQKYFLTETKDVAETSAWVGEVVDADLVGHVVPVEVVPKVGEPDGILRTQSVKVVPKVGNTDGILWSKCW